MCVDPGQRRNKSKIIQFLIVWLPLPILLLSKFDAKDYFHNTAVYLHRTYCVWVNDEKKYKSVLD